MRNPLELVCDVQDLLTDMMVAYKQLSQEDTQDIALVVCMALVSNSPSRIQIIRHHNLGNAGRQAPSSSVPYWPFMAI